MNTEYAMKAGHLTHVSEVESGLKCDCICPCCSKKMIARKGKKMAHHFAHQNAECSYGLETTLHLMAKDILEQEKRLLLPKVIVSLPYRVSETISMPKMIEADEVSLEKRFDEFVPDILVKVGEKLLAIEIWVTHKIDERKLEKIKKSNISVLEINLSKTDKMINVDDLRKILTEETECKNWAYNCLSEYYKQKWLSVCEVKEIISRGLALHIDYCPIAARVWHGKPYANMMDDCASCQFFVHTTPHYDPTKNDEFGNDKLLYCSGKKMVGSISDLKEYIKKVRK